AALARALRQDEARKRDLAGRLTAARQKAANPLSASWGEAQSLLAALDAAPDLADARVRLRAVLRRVVESVSVLFVKLGRYDRVAAVQIWFHGGAHRDYLIYHQPARGFGKGKRTAQNWT